MNLVLRYDDPRPKKFTDGHHTIICPIKDRRIKMNLLIFIDNVPWTYNFGSYFYCLKILVQDFSD